jgi:hypothetical protein
MAQCPEFKPQYCQKKKKGGTIGERESVQNMELLCASIIYFYILLLGIELRASNIPT